MSKVILPISIKHHGDGLWKLCYLSEYRQEVMRHNGRWVKMALVMAF